MHPFDTALQLTKTADSWQGQTAAAYSNMVGPFGGLTAAVLLKAILDHPQRQGDPVTLTVNFAAPVQEGAFTVTPTLMRHNRSTQHWWMTQSQKGEIVSTATAVFAQRRDSWEATDLTCPTLPPKMQPLTTAALPNWTNQYEMTLPDEIVNLFAAPHADTPATSETLQTMRDQPPRPVDFLSLTAMSDIFFPRIMVRLRQFVPAGTVAMTIYYHCDAAQLAAQGDGTLIGHARAQRFYNRYFDQSAELWTPNGQLLATSTQIVYFKKER